jgi:hypothetical protein
MANRKVVQQAVQEIQARFGVMALPSRSIRHFPGNRVIQCKVHSGSTLNLIIPILKKSEIEFVTWSDKSNTPRIITVYNQAGQYEVIANFPNNQNSFPYSAAMYVLEDLYDLHLFIYYRTVWQDPD